MSNELDIPDARPQGQYKEDMQALMRAAGPRLFMAYYHRLTAEPDAVKTDDLRKGVELIIGATDAALERKTDANANLPVFNITFDMKTGTMAATQVVEEVKPIEEIEDVPVRSAQQEALPAEPQPPAFDVDEMFQALDNLLPGGA